MFIHNLSTTYDYFPYPTEKLTQAMSQRDERVSILVLSVSQHKPLTLLQGTSQFRILPRRHCRPW
jgi:hypothetical protein